MTTNSNTELTVWNYQEQKVRMVEREDGVWWILGDVCDVLHINNSRMVKERLNPIGVSLADMNTPRGIRRATIINEPNLYRLILRSDKPEARAFESWIVEEVLPTIRKIGRYDPNPTPVICGVEEAFTLLANKEREQDEEIARGKQERDELRVELCELKELLSTLSDKTNPVKQPIPLIPPVNLDDEGLKERRKALFHRVNELAGRWKMTPTWIYRETQKIFESQTGISLKVQKKLYDCTPMDYITNFGHLPTYENILSEFERAS